MTFQYKKLPCSDNENEECSLTSCPGRVSPHATRQVIPLSTRDRGETVGPCTRRRSLQYNIDGIIERSISLSSIGWAPKRSHSSFHRSQL